jgi:hypothetical protein
MAVDIATAREIREELITRAEAAEAAAREATDILVDGEAFSGHTETLVGLALNSWDNLLPMIEDLAGDPRYADILDAAVQAVGRTLAALQTGTNAEYRSF